MGGFERLSRVLAPVFTPGTKERLALAAPLELARRRFLPIQIEGGKTAAKDRQSIPEGGQPALNQQVAPVRPDNKKPAGPNLHHPKISSNRLSFRNWWGAISLARR
jgi:hypothetical protein